MALLSMLALSVLAASEPTFEVGPHRYAMIIGANHGNADEPTLRYATTDAADVATVLTDMGDFDRDDVHVLTNPSARDVRLAFADLRMQIARNRGASQGSFLVVYYSGHADATTLHLGGTTLAWGDILNLTNGSQADLRLLVVDACRSGELTQTKGAHLDNPFALPHNAEELPRGIAIVTSASAGESAQESARLHASFFTHHLVSGLRGAADMNADGKVTLNEVFNYSSEQAAGDTAQTLAGVQHATYHFHLTGRVDLGLTTPAHSANLSALRINSSGTYVFRQVNEKGLVVLQTHVANGVKRAVWLPTGRYFVQRRTPSAVYAGTVQVGDTATPSSLNVAQLEKTEFAAVSHKGGPAIGTEVDREPRSHLELTLSGTSGAAVLPGFQTPAGAALGVAVPMSWGNGNTWALDFHLTAMHVNAINKDLTTSEWDTDATAGIRATLLDVGPLRLSAGPRVGALLLNQSYSGSGSGAARRQLAPVIEGNLRLDLQLPGIWFISLQGTARGAWVQVLNTDQRSTHGMMAFQPLAALGVGAAW